MEASLAQTCDVEADDTAHFYDLWSSCTHIILIWIDIYKIAIIQ